MADVKRRGAWVVVLVAVVVAGGCSSGGEGGASSPTTAGEIATSVRVDGGGTDAPVVTVAGSGSGGVAPERVLVAFDRVRGRVAIPDDAVGCVVAKLALDEELVVAVEAVGDGGVPPSGLMDLGGECMSELHAAPAFVAGVEAQVAGGLSERERACLLEGFGTLGSEAVDAAIAEAVGADADVSAAEQVGDGDCRVIR